MRLRAGLLVAWATAVLDGRSSPDQAAAVVGGDRPGPRVAGLPGEAEPVSLPYALASLRRLGVRGLRLVLPVPGDVAGLPGPPELNAAAVQAGAAVLAERTGGPALLFLLDRLDWTVHPAGTAGTGVLPGLAEAERELAEAMREVTEAMNRLDVARMPAQPASARHALHCPPQLRLPPGHPARAVRVALAAVRLLTVVDVARLDEGASVSTAQMRLRAQLLGQVERVARRALCAAASEAGRDAARSCG